MAFDINNFKETNGPGNRGDGGQLYIQHSSVDNLATMVASGYFNDLQAKLNTNDVMIVSASDGVNIGKLVNTAGVMTFVGQV